MENIVLQGISHNYGENQVLRNINIQIAQGEFFTLLGPSGCGKTTLLRILAGFITPSQGQILLDGKDITALPPEKRGMGVVFQNYALFPNMTVEENIAYGLKVRRAPKQEIADKCRRYLELTGLEEYKTRKIDQLSGGQQQRVAIARALIVEPEMLLLDEPLSNLDARLRLQTREEIKRIQKETGITTIFVTHDQEEAMSISDIIVVMKDGMVQQIGRPQEVYDSPANLFVAKFLGTPPVNVFEGQVKDGWLTIGKDAVLPVKGAAEDPVYAGIRPEGFLLRKGGAFGCELSGVEVMGRDISVVCANSASLSPAIRAIIGSENMAEVSMDARQVRFDLKPGKVFLFDRKTEERIEFDASAISRL